MIYKLKESRVYRPFLGGKLLDALRGVQNPTDGHYPERWLGSTVAAQNGAGLAYTTNGKAIRDLYPGEVDVLAKLLDSATRLMIQTHPNDLQAQKYFGYPYGKRECWYILGVRTINNEDPYVLLGFRPGITKEKWQDAHHRQDISAMLGMLNRIPVKPGEVYLIPPNVPHAMGSGVFFAEAQQPSDFTFRTEYTSPAGKMLTEEDLHMGAGFDALFDCFSYEASLPQDYRVQPEGSAIIRDEHFHIHRFKGPAQIKIPRFAIAAVLSGEGHIGNVALAPGDEVFATEEMTIGGTPDILVFAGKADIQSG